MLAKRIIPCLDVTAGRVVKGVNFVNLRDAGDPVELADRYNLQGADELVFLDISASHEGRAILDVGGQKIAAAPQGVPAPGHAVTVVVRPEAIAISSSDTGLTAVVQSRIYLGDKIEYEISFGGQLLNIVRFNPADDEGCLPGTTVSIAIAPADIRLVD